MQPLPRSTATRKATPQIWIYLHLGEVRNWMTAAKARAVA